MQTPEVRPALRPLPVSVRGNVVIADFDPPVGCLVPDRKDPEVAALLERTAESRRPEVRMRVVRTEIGFALAEAESYRQWWLLRRTGSGIGEVGPEWVEVVEVAAPAPAVAKPVQSAAVEAMPPAAAPVAPPAPTAAPVVMRIDLDALVTDAGLQTRVAMSEAVVAEYADALSSGVVLPPVTVFRDGDGPAWLADGYHRVEAARRAGLDVIEARVHSGGRRDALLYSVGANSTHGLRRTNEDKRKAVGVLLDDPEWSAWTDRRIAEACGVSNTFVGAQRREHLSTVDRCGADEDLGATDGDVATVPTMRRVARGGREYVVDTSRINAGRVRPMPALSADASAPDPTQNDDPEPPPAHGDGAADSTPSPVPQLPVAAGPDARDTRIAQLEAENAALKANLAATDTKQRKPIAIERDVIGQVIPEELRPIFSVYEEYRRLIHNHLHTASRMGRKWIEVIQAESARLGFQRATLDQDYRGLVANFALGADSWSKAPHAAIEHAAPSVVCIHCAGSACERCNGRGWFSGQLHIDFYRRELARLSKESAA